LGTNEVFWEVAAGALIGAVCGLNQHGVGATAGNERDHTSGLEARFQIETAHAALGLTRKEINECVIECLSHYEHTLDNPNIGKPFPEIYDTDALEPKGEWLDKYGQVKFELKKIGLDLDTGWRKVHHASNLASTL